MISIDTQARVISGSYTNDKGENIAFSESFGTGKHAHIRFIYACVYYQSLIG